MEKKINSEHTHFFQAKEVISSWPQWKQELACTSLNSNQNQNNEKNNSKEE